MVRSVSSVYSLSGEKRFHWYYEGTFSGKVRFKQTYSSSQAAIAGSSELYCECSIPPSTITPGESLKLKNRLYAAKVSGYGQYMTCQVQWGSPGYAISDFKSNKTDTSSASEQSIGEYMGGFDEKNATVSVSVPSESYGNTFSIYFYNSAGLYEWQYTLRKAESSSAQKANPLTVKANTITFKASDIKKKAQSVKASEAFTVKKAKGTVTYKATKNVTKNAMKKVTVAKKGKVTVKKGTKKGTYKLKVKVTAAGNTTYKKGSKTVTLIVKVK